MTNDELMLGVMSFLTAKLDISGISRDDVEKILPAKIRSGPRVKNEVIVLFRDVNSRDEAMSAAAKIAPYVDPQGLATAGMRLEVPPRLQQEFRVLYKYGQMLWTRHGQGTRRHIKFDDPTRSLYLNVKLPGDEAWSKVSTGLARRGMRARQIQTDQEIERRLDITGPRNTINNNRPRSTSLSTAPDQQMETSTWTQQRSESVLS